MNIAVFGAGAIGSLFGGFLSTQHNVILIGRKPHITAIQRNGLQIYGETDLQIKLPAVDEITNINEKIDVLLLTVKSYDTKEAIQQAHKIITNNTIVLSLQNGLNNIETIKNVVPENQIIAGVTTHGVVFQKPGVIHHTGKGTTVIGAIDTSQKPMVTNIARLFSTVGITTTISNDIYQEIWKKAIINSSINPLTTIFSCKNGYLKKNKILEHIVKKICIESTQVAQAQGIILTEEEMISDTFEVVTKTADNFSSMYQSVLKGSRTEINEINGKIMEYGTEKKVDTPLNSVLVTFIKQLTISPKEKQ